MGSNPPAKPRGRPRDPLIEDAILKAVLRRLAVDGYARMTLADVAKEAGVTRPTIYLRWTGKPDLVMEALEHAFRAERAANPPPDLQAMSAKEAMVEAVRRLDPRAHDKGRMRLIGMVLAESEHTPDLLELIRTHAMKLRQSLLLDTLRVLQARGDLRPDLDLEMLADMCTGSYFATYLRAGDTDSDQPSRVVESLWEAVVARP
jgi:AcrR family transcriptional regulator